MWEKCPATYSTTNKTAGLVLLPVMKKFNLLMVSLFLGLVAAAQAAGTADTEVAAGIENGMATWTLVKAALIVIAVALIGIRFLRRVK